MRKRDKLARSVPDLIKKLTKDLEDYEGPVWFRGQSKKDWPLLPSIARENNGLSEMDWIKKFKQNATMLLSPPPNESIDWLFIMQHHGIPTRLLDWTESPLIAIYFAVYKNDDVDGALWALLPVELNKKSNVAPDYFSEIPSFEEDEVMKNYKPDSFIRETRSKLLPAAIIAPRNNPRMQSQLSVFTINHRDNTSIERIGDKQHIWRYVIPNENKNIIKKELKLIGISKFQLFPELQSIGEMIKGED